MLITFLSYSALHAVRQGLTARHSVVQSMCELLYLTCNTQTEHGYDRGAGEGVAVHEVHESCVPCAQEEAQAAESQNSALLLARAERYASEFELLQDTFACARACFCRA